MERSQKPLANEAAREAVDSMRGYSYQILFSVRSWVTLPKNHLLYLEGAEDLDQMTPDTVTATQVKFTRTTATVTLRSPGVLQALNNFWSHRERNRGRNIHFRYITTSTAGFEKGAPFGRKVSGIELWRRVQDNIHVDMRPQTLETIRTFLLKEHRLSEKLKEFLKACALDEFEAEIIRPIHWDITANDPLALYSEIRSLLIELGIARQVPTSDAEVVIHALYHEAWKVATKDKNRYLDHPSLVRIFDENTRISVPKSQLTAMIARLLPAEVKGANLATIIADQRAIGSLPPLSPRYFERASFIERMKTAIGQNTVSVLQGSTGMGKTTTAIAITLQHKDSWGWLSLRGCDAQSIKRRLAAALADIRQGYAPLCLIIDDLDAIEDFRSCETVIAEIATAQKQRSGKVIICAAQEPFSRMKQALDVNPSQILRIPPFSRGEIDGFLAQSMCIDKDRRSTWAGILELTTRGHPQLVHARVASLSAQGFPPPDPRDLLQTPQDVKDVHTEARRLLLALDAPQRELIYRLSLTASPLNRDQIVAIGVSAPAIDEPGNSLDKLIGPWVEHIGDGLYRTSPLVGDVGQSVSGVEWNQRTHGNIASALLSFSTVTPSDVSTIFLHCFAGRDEYAFASLSFSLMSESSEIWHAISNHLFWLIPIGLDNDMRFMFTRQSSLFLFRLVQMRIASASNAPELPRIIARALEEFPHNPNATLRDVERYLLLGEILLHHSATLDVDQLLGLASEFVVDSDRLKNSIDYHDSPELEDMLTGPTGEIDLATIVGMGVFESVRDSSDLLALVVSLEKWDRDTVQRVLWMISQDEMFSGSLLNRVWLSEYQRDEKRWTEFLEVCEGVYTFAQKHEMLTLAGAAAKVICRVIDENQSSPHAAIERAGEFVLEIGDTPSLQDGRARILAHMQKDVEALQLWRSALPRWEVDKADISPCLGFREAGISASRLGFWREAAELFLDGGKRMAAQQSPALKIGLVIDAGFAYWKAGDNRRAHSLFKEGLAELDAKQDQCDAEPVYSLQKRIGHTGMWVHNMAGGGSVPDGYSEPNPGFCSVLEPLRGESLRGTPIDYISASFVDFEEASGLGDELFLTYMDRGKTSPYLAVRISFLEKILRWRLSELETVGLYGDIIDLVSCVLALQEYTSKDSEKRSNVLVEDVEIPRVTEASIELAQMYALVGMFSVVAGGRMTAEIAKSWRTEIEGLEFKHGLDEWLGLVDGLFISGGIDAEERTRSGQDGWCGQCLASLRLAACDDVDPNLLIQCHGLWVKYLMRLPNRNFVGADVAKLVSEAWMGCASRPFLLVSPRSSVPALRAALAAPEEGWGHVRLILCAASDAVSHDARATVRSVLFPS